VILSSRSYYTQSKFQLIYARAMKKSLEVQQSHGTTSMTLGLPGGTLLMSNKEDLFDYPFNELLVSVCLKLAVREYYMALSLNTAF
jgi:hypothetical protein